MSSQFAAGGIMSLVTIGLVLLGMVAIGGVAFYGAAVYKSWGLGTLGVWAEVSGIFALGYYALPRPSSVQNASAYMAMAGGYNVLARLVGLGLLLAALFLLMSDFRRFREGRPVV